MNLQLESHTNQVNATTDSAMHRIKLSSMNQVIHTNSFGKVNKKFCEFAVDFMSMLLVYNAWSSHVSQTVPAPHARQVPKEKVYDSMMTNRTILVHFILGAQVSQAGTFFIMTTFFMIICHH